MGSHKKKRNYICGKPVCVGDVQAIWQKIGIPDIFENIILLNEGLHNCY